MQKNGGLFITTYVGSVNHNIKGQNLLIIIWRRIIVLSFSNNIELFQWKCETPFANVRSFALKLKGLLPTLGLQKFLCKKLADVFKGGLSLNSEAKYFFNKKTNEF